MKLFLVHSFTMELPRKAFMHEYKASFSALEEK